ncbi:M55 family metallopeptidase, partial [candidate division KSB1 bacterium]
MIKKKNIILSSISLILILGLIHCFFGCTPQTKKGLKIYIDSDLEGASGVVHFDRHSRATAPLFEQSKILLTKEINAAIEGLIEEGVSEIVLWDDHGPGGINIEYLHPAAKVAMGQGESILNTIDSSFDALIFIGKHPMSNTPNGNLAHSFSSKAINNIWLNGKLIGEVGWAVLMASYYNVPTIFLSGDDAVCDEIKDLIPNVETVAVKKGLGLNSALCLP